jgi:hypothetical protein
VWDWCGTGVGLGLVYVNSSPRLTPPITSAHGHGLGPCLLFLSLVRGDAFKLMYSCRRPLPRADVGIGEWQAALPFSFSLFLCSVILWHPSVVRVADSRAVYSQSDAGNGKLSGSNCGGVADTMHYRPGTYDGACKPHGLEGWAGYAYYLC